MKHTLVCFFLFVQICCFGQDQFVTAVTGPKTFVQYTNFSTNISVKNDGIVGIPQVSGIMVLSADTLYGWDDILVGFFEVHNLAAGTTAVTKESFPVCIRSVPGTYNLIILTSAYDGVGKINETNEDNNTFVEKGYVIESPVIDLAFESFSVKESSSPANEVAHPIFKIVNSGSTDIDASVYTEFYFSTDEILDNNDTDIGYSISGWLVGPDTIKSGIRDEIFMPSIPPGNYYIIGKTDARNEITETNEDNNTVVYPITIVPPDIDLQILSAHMGDIDDSYFWIEFELKNNGSTGVTGYTVTGTLELGNDGAYYSHQFNDWDDFIPGGQSKTLRIEGFRPNTGGNYALSMEVNPNRDIQETNTDNNIFTGFAWMPDPPVPSLVITALSFAEQYDNTDKELILNVSFMNTGTAHSHTQQYSIQILNAQSEEVVSQSVYEHIYVSPENTTTLQWYIQLNDTLPIGDYTVEVKCKPSTFCYTTEKKQSFKIIKPVYVISGTIEGESSLPITKGNLFLYEKNESGLIKFVQKISLTTTNTFSFSFKQDLPRTLYFIPDASAFPNYVPTIYGKTVALNDNSFFNGSKADVVFEILKIQTLPPGPGRISGSVTTDIAPGRTQEGVSYPVVLMSKSGEAVGLTYTNENGYFEFNNLPPDEYGVFVSIELDQPVMEEPFPVDITTDNMTVKIHLTEEGVVTESLVTGLEERNSFISVYPIPTHNVVTIKSVQPIVNIEVTDIAGRIQSEIGRNGNRLDISSIDTGIYFLKIFLNSSVQIVKIAKE